MKTEMKTETKRTRVFARESTRVVATANVSR
jgi:hypothetical protein